MSLLTQMQPGIVWDPGLLARMLPGEAPDPVVSIPAGIPVELGYAFVPVPGPMGPVSTTPGPIGPPGDYTQQTDHFLVSVDGPQTLHLSRTPASTDISVFLNGLYQLDLSDVQTSGAVMVFPPAWHLLAGDQFAVQYGYLPDPSHL